MSAPKGKPSARDLVVTALKEYEVGEVIAYKDLAVLIGAHDTTVSSILSSMVYEGTMERAGRGQYRRLAAPVVPTVLATSKLTFDLVKVRADGSRIVTDESGELYVITLVVI
jgi:predicted transcriptional regulator of viral defense system